ncbi:ABC transporter ATP-binding protein [Bacillus sp. NEB1478]|uniref:ABC transporter ATP-binding protein n=1 Tax=Bacillus sp. NEB1478 TaxID=3073816 RepID=UPI002873EDCB|nr:ABC transporter ATP-binding protein [Bacillus sp. NEB1478]WNB92452.1 ABC transporter ATP-binding protein [Bacillus sp. NEB1478]
MKSILYITKQLYQFTGNVLIINIFAIALVSMLEGIGLILLVPMLQISKVIDVDQTFTSSVTLNKLFNAVDSLPDRYALLIILFLFVMLVSGQAILKRSLALRNIKIHVRFINQLRLNTYKGLLEANWLFCMKKRKSDFINVMTDDIGRVMSGTNLFLQLLTSIVFTAIQLIIAFWLSPKITAFVLCTGGILAYVLKKNLQNSKKAGLKKSEISKSYIGGLTENFSGIKDIKCNNLEASRYLWLKNWCESIEKEQIQFVKLLNNSQLFYKIMSAFLIAILIMISVTLFQDQPTQLLLIILIFSRLWPRFMGIQTYLQQIYNSIPAFKSLLHLQSESTKASEQIINRNVPIIPKKINRKIECKNVNFSYDSKAKYDLKNINVKINANEMTAIVGRSGAGKSTLTDILMGLIQPNEGEVLIDGELVTKEDLLSIRKAISYVPQDPFLFNGSIRDNLLLIDPNASEEQMLNALKFASADFVFTLTNGLDTLIGDRGVKFSGGERQRIVLARAILRNPSVLILDEATSALDSENEAKIQEALEKLKGKMTIIVIAHRLSTIRNADQIIVLENGQVIQNGNFKVLAKEKQKTFSFLLEKQMVIK